MSPLNVFIGAIAAGFLLLVGAYNNSGSLSQAATKPSTVRLVAIDLNFKSSGEEANDHKVISQIVLSPEGILIGNAYTVCFVIDKGIDECGGVYNLPKGKITFTGSRQSRSRYVFVITGGTGVYSGASGKLNSIVFGTKPFREKIIIDII